MRPPQGSGLCWWCDEALLKEVELEPVAVPDDHLTIDHRLRGQAGDDGRDIREPVGQVREGKRYARNFVPEGPMLLGSLG